jgi:alkylmercury lyase
MQRAEDRSAMNRAIEKPVEKMTAASKGRRANDTRAAFTDYLKRAVLAANAPQMQRLSVALYRLLGRGAPVAREQLAAACGLSREQVERLMAEFPPTAVELDGRGAVVAFSGLSVVATHHEFVTDEAKLHTWCAFDALFLPEILGKSATLVTHCPASGAELTVELAPGELRAARPSNTVMSIVTPDRKACCDNLRRAFCDQVNLFLDHQTFIGWSRGREGAGCLTLEEAQLFARRRNALRYPDVELGM